MDNTRELKPFAEKYAPCAALNNIFKVNRRWLHDTPEDFCHSLNSAREAQRFYKAARGAYKKKWQQKRRAEKKAKDRLRVWGLGFIGFRV